MFRLQKSTVWLAAHHSEWHELFQNEKERLVEGMKNYDVTIEHIGSTAIPFVPAKPIVDIILGIDQAIELSAMRPVLKNLGYVDQGPQGVPHRILWVFGIEEDRKFHLYLTHKGSRTWNDCIAFRTALRSAASIREEYAKFKNKFAMKYPEDRELYMRKKHEFIERVTRQYQSSHTLPSRQSMLKEIISALERRQNILLVGRRDAGKTYFVTNQLIPLLRTNGMDVHYYKDMDEEIHVLHKDEILIFDEFELLDDKESLERMHPEEQPYYLDSYLLMVHEWLQKAECVPNRRIFILSRNEEDIGCILGIASFNFAPNVVVIEVVPWGVV